MVLADVYILADESMAPRLLSKESVSPVISQGAPSEIRKWSQAQGLTVYTLKDGRMIVDARMRTPLAKRRRSLRLLQRFGTKKGGQILRWKDVAGEVGPDFAEAVEFDSSPANQQAPVFVKPAIRMNLSLNGKLVHASLEVPSDPKQKAMLLQRPVAAPPSDVRNVESSTNQIPYHWAIRANRPDGDLTADETANVLSQLSDLEDQAARELAKTKAQVLAEIMKSNGMEWALKALKANSFYDLDPEHRKQLLDSADRTFSANGFRSPLEMRTFITNSRVDEVRPEISFSVGARGADGKPFVLTMVL
jgi:hypothetical protein